MKYTLSVLVEDESGVLSRISGLFARRGFNIESLAVGTSYPVQQPQPGGGIKWIHNSTELASIQLASGVDNTLEINSTVGVNISSLTIANTLDVKTVKRKILHEKMNWNTSFVDSHTMNILDDGSVLHIYGGSNNLTLNIRGNASTTLDSILGTVTHTLTVKLLVNHGGGTAGPLNTIKIDDVTQTVKYCNTVAPVANSKSVYTISIIKTAANTYEVLTKFDKFA